MHLSLWVLYSISFDLSEVKFSFFNQLRMITADGHQELGIILLKSELFSLKRSYGTELFTT